MIRDILAQTNKLKDRICQKEGADYIDSLELKVNKNCVPALPAPTNAIDGIATLGATFRTASLWQCLILNFGVVELVHQ